VLQAKDYFVQDVRGKQDAHVRKCCETWYQPPEPAVQGTSSGGGLGATAAAAPGAAQGAASASRHTGSDAARASAPSSSRPPAAAADDAGTGAYGHRVLGKAVCEAELAGRCFHPAGRPLGLCKMQHAWFVAEHISAHPSSQQLFHRCRAWLSAYVVYVRSMAL
jgi:hypothetical protein